MIQIVVSWTSSESSCESLIVSRDRRSAMDVWSTWTQSQDLMCFLCRVRPDSRPFELSSRTPARSIPVKCRVTAPEKDDHANWRWRTRPRRQVHLGGPRRESSDIAIAEGDLLPEDQNFEPFQNGTWAVTGPIDCFLSKIQVQSYVFSDYKCV